MKKLLTIVTLLGMAFLSYGDAFVNFSLVSGGNRIMTNAIAAGGTEGRTATNANGFYYALMVAPTTQTTITTTADPTLFGWAFTGDIGTNVGVGGGLMSGDGGPGAYDDSSVLISGYAPDSIVNFAVVGWSANIGSTWLQAESWWNDGNPSDPYGSDGNLAFFGISSIATNVVLAAPPGPWNSIWGLADSGLIPGMTLYTVVPEPATFALAGMGATALAVFRRRRQSKLRRN